MAKLVDASDLKSEDRKVVPVRFRSRAPTKACKLTQPQPTNPLHGITLERLLEALVERLGWDNMAKALPIRCFSNDPSIASSLRFLRRTPWARIKVETLYLEIVAAKGEH